MWPNLKKLPGKYRGSTPEVTPEVALLAVLKGELDRRALQDALGLKSEEHFRKAYLLPALKSGLIEMTFPDKPRSSKQRYRITPRGKRVLKKHREEKQLNLGTKYTRVEYERRFLVSPQAEWRSTVEPYSKSFEDKYLQSSRLRLRVLTDSDTGQRIKPPVYAGREVTEDLFFTGGNPCRTTRANLLCARWTCSSAAFALKAPPEAAI